MRYSSIVILNLFQDLSHAWLFFSFEVPAYASMTNQWLVS
jgi:hypothetical protein